MASGKKKIPLGIQLFSVRNDCEKDFPAVLRELKSMGYDGVEFAGYYARSAQDVRKLLDDNGLKCCGTHLGLDALLGDNFKKTAEFNQVIGNKYLIVAWMGKERMGSLQLIKQTVALYNELADKAKPMGMRVGYHAHDGDFVPAEGQLPWNVLFAGTKADVTMQMDIGNCIQGGADPYAILRKFPGRSATIHLKEHGGPEGAVIGEGIVKWQDVFDICQTTGGTEWYIVEQEGYGPGRGPLDSARRCIENLRKMGL
jgi:sugar phosphate isomerase/epimerase